MNLAATHKQSLEQTKPESRVQHVPNRRLLIIDFSGREQYPPAVVAPLFEGAGEAFVLHTNPVGIRTFLKDTARLAWRSFPRFRARAALWLFGSSGELADTTIRGDLRIQDRWRIRHIRPAPWGTVLRTLAAFVKPATWRAATAMRTGQFSHLAVNDVDISGYVLDSIIRWRSPSIMFNGPAVLAQPYTALQVARYVAWAQYAGLLAKRFEFTDFLINHVVYAESGMIARILQAQLGEGVRGHLASYVHAELVRVPPLPFCPFTTVTQAELQSGEDAREGVPPEWYVSNSITHRIGMQPGAKKRHVMLAMHCFRDACDVYTEHDAAFPTYYAWVDASIEAARQQPALSLLLRRHPAHLLYGPDEEKLTQHLYHQAPPNCTVLGPGLEDVEKYLAQSVVVTFKGSIALELACAGKRVVTVAPANCPDSCYTRIHTAEEYHAFLNGGYVDFDDSLSPEDVQSAQRYRAAYYRVLQRTHVTGDVW
jgi:hypothetical protein